MDNYFIWRYMDFWKFEKIVRANELFFSFKNYFDSASEGKKTKFTFSENVEYLLKIAILSRNLYNSNANLIINKGNKQNIFDIVKHTDSPQYIVPDPEIEANRTQKIIQQQLNKIGICCWTAESGFSTDIYKKFVNGLDGVAIKVDKNELLMTLSKENITYEAQKINYINPQKETFDPLVASNFLFHMDKGYSSEKEFRIIIPLYRMHDEMAYRSMLRCLAEYKRKKDFEGLQELMQVYNENHIFNGLRNGEYLKRVFLRAKAGSRGVSVPVNILSSVKEVACLNGNTAEKVRFLMPNVNITVHK